METLVYVDPAPRGEWALTLAAALPPARLQAVCLLATAEDVRAHPALLERARTQLARAGEVRESVVPGPAERAVSGAALAQAYGLIVVPPAGRNALQRMLKGSRVATVVRNVRSPVLVARRPRPRVERVLCAVSGRASTAAVTAAADEFAGAGVQVVYVHVACGVALPHQAADGGGMPSDAEADGVSELRARLTRIGRSDALRVREGLVVEEILDEFESGACDLLVAGGQGGEAAASWTREDVTERLLLGCPGSVLIVPA